MPRAHASSKMVAWMIGAACAWALTVYWIGLSFADVPAPTTSSSGTRTEDLLGNPLQSGSVIAVGVWDPLKQRCVFAQEIGVAITTQDEFTPTVSWEIDTLCRAVVKSIQSVAPDPMEADPPSGGSVVMLPGQDP